MKTPILTHLSRARLALAAGDVPAALRQAGRALTQDPACAQARLLRAGLFILEGRPDDAAGDLEAMEGLHYRKLMKYRDFSTVSPKTHPAIVERTALLLRGRPELAWGWVFYGFLLRVDKRGDEALVCAARAASLAPRAAALRAMVSRLRLSPQDSAAALSDMQEAVRLEPRWGWLHCWRGEALRLCGRHEEALACLDRGLRLDPSYTRAYSWRGAAKRALGRLRPAVLDLTRALRWEALYDEDHAFAADQLAWAFHQRSLCLRALAQEREALLDMDAAHRLASSFIWAPRGETTESLDGLIARFPDFAPAWAWRGWTCRLTAERDRSRADLDAALNLAPKNGVYRAWRGRLFSVDGDFKAARAALDQAVTLEPHYAPAYAWRAIVLKAQGKKTAAQADRKTALRLDPNVLLEDDNDR